MLLLGMQHIVKVCFKYQVSYYESQFWAKASIHLIFRANEKKLISLFKSYFCLFEAAPQFVSKLIKVELLYAYETLVFKIDFSCIFPGICGDSNGMILTSNGREHLVLWTFIGELKLENTKAFNCVTDKRTDVGSHPLCIHIQIFSTRKMFFFSLFRVKIFLTLSYK